MIELLRCFLDICLLRKAPQDLPASSFLLGLAAAFFIIVDVSIALLSLPLGQALALTLVDAVVLAGLLWVLLWIRELLPRYTQTLTALYGACMVMQIVAAPVVLWQWNAVPESIGMALASLLLWIWLLWNLFVIGHVIRHAASTVLPVGVGLALLYLFVTFSITRTIFFPEATV
ncbi:MAG: hypothetical protein LBV36_07860 [Chromatiales bacterium]|nr:hypothetical protein [Chromatiales bacterium]